MLAGSKRVSLVRTALIVALAWAHSACGGAVDDAPSDADALEDEATEELGTVSSALVSDVAVYSERALVSPWQNWSWGATVSTTNAAAPRVTGSATQIKATMQRTWGALSLARPAGELPIADYVEVVFDVRGETPGTAYFGIETLAGAAGPLTPVPLTTSWSRRRVALDTVKGGLVRFGKLNVLGSGRGQSIYVDNVSVVAKTSLPKPPSPTPAPLSPTPTPPSAPMAVNPGNVVTLASPLGPYHAFVPQTYDASHRTPARLLVWMHGCGGNSYGDAWVVSPSASQSWITLSVGGRDGGCWSVGRDTRMVLAAIDDLQRRLNIDRRRIVIGGYSSGADMAYRTAFYNAGRFAGVIAADSAPFRDTGSTQAASIAAASWKLNIAHLAHLGDKVYPIERVRAELDALVAAGFPVRRIERPGTHFDKGTATSGTTFDIRRDLLPLLDGAWLAP